MKKTKLLFFFFFTSFAAFTQPFGGNLAVWHYSQFNPWMPANYPVQISSAPFVFNGINCFRLSISSATCPTDTAYTVYESNDSVYYYLPPSNRFTMLYNFNALPGDTETIFGINIQQTGEDSIKYKVDSVSAININGLTKKIFYTTPVAQFPNSNLEFFGTIIEDIGCTEFLFPQIATCDPLVIGLRCYEDTIIGLYQPDSIDCDSTFILGENEWSFTPEISVYPNPAKDFISITFSLPQNKNANMEFYNLYGQKLKTLFTGKLFEGKKEMKFSLKEFPAGIYFVKINADGKEEVREVVKY